MDEVYQKVAYIGLRNDDGTYLINVPLYVKLSEVNKSGISEQQEELIHKISDIMMKRYEKQVGGYIEKLKKGVKDNANVSCGM